MKGAKLDSRAGIIGVILAGGSARRMGGRDKALIELNGQPLLAHVTARLAPQVEIMVLSANGDPAPYAPFGLPIVADSIEDGGPLAGILAAMDWARAQHPEAKWLASVAVDTPLFPTDLVERLHNAVGKEHAAVATSAGQLHPTFGLFNVGFADDLRAYLTLGGRKARGWAGVTDAVSVDFAAGPTDPFANINSPEDLADMLNSFPFARERSR